MVFGADDGYNDSDAGWKMCDELNVKIKKLQSRIDKLREALTQIEFFYDGSDKKYSEQEIAHNALKVDGDQK